MRSDTDVKAQQAQQFAQVTPRARELSSPSHHFICQEY